MSVNLNRPDMWKSDIVKSVDMYNQWFMNFAPKAFRETRLVTTKEVEAALKLTDNLKKITPHVLKSNPGILPTLRMSTCPPIAVDRLIGLADVPNSLVKRIENKKKMPIKLTVEQLNKELEKISKIIGKMIDPDIFVWISENRNPKEDEIHRAATIVADRLCGSVANPIIRNAQEKRQFDVIAKWLMGKGYRKLQPDEKLSFMDMPNGTFGFHINVPVKLEGGTRNVNIPIDIVIKPTIAKKGEFPILFEAKSAGDFTNVNKRRKEEAMKMSQLRNTYGNSIRFNLFLCGYFDSGYLGYEAAEGIDWVWEHRIDDFERFGL